MKTIREYLITLPLPYNQMALNNSDVHEVPAWHLQDAIEKAFVWCDSPEGHEFWQGLRDNVVYLEQQNNKK